MPRVIYLVGPPPATQPEEGVEVSFGPTTGLVVDTPRNFARFQFHFASWLRFDVTKRSREDADVAFQVPLARPIVQATFFDDLIELFFQPELAGATPRFLDGFVQLNAHDAARFRLGQFRTPFSRAFITPALTLQLPSRGVVNDTFRLGRDAGLMFFGDVAGGVFEYYAGVFNGAAINTLDGNEPAPMGVARAVINIGERLPYDQSPAAMEPLDGPGVAIGLDGAYRQRHVVTEANGFDPPREVSLESWHVAADVAVAAGPASVHAEGFVRYTDDEPDSNVGDGFVRDMGASLQAGVFLVPQTLEVAARGGWMDREMLAGQSSYEFGLNGYWPYPKTLGHHLKMQLRYAIDLADPPVAARGIARETHRFTLQVQTWL